MREEPKAEAPVLFMEDVSFSYAGGRAKTGVKGISLSLGRGEVALLCGPSGCGKTTVTRLANGLAPHFYEGAETGTVRVCGLDVAHAGALGDRTTRRQRLSEPQNPVLQRRRPRGGRLRVRESGIQARRHRTASGRCGKGVRPCTPDRREPLFSFGRSEAARGVRERGSDISRTRRAGRTVVQPRLRGDRAASLGHRALEGRRDRRARGRASDPLPRGNCGSRALPRQRPHRAPMDGRRVRASRRCRAHAARAARARHRRHLPKQRPLRRSGKARHAKGSTRKRYGALREPDGALPEERSPRKDPRNRQPRASRRERHGVGRLMRRRQIDVRRSRMRPQPMRRNRDFERSPFGKARS